MEYKNLSLIDNTELKRFEMLFDNVLNHISYKKTKNTIELFPSYSCKGINSLKLKDELMWSILDYIKMHELKLIPSCPYVALYVMKNSEWREYVIE